ncbi:MAG TPA: phage terminase large subunit, partial [Thermoleophilaceae bacterium]|nr:phage terminase large subunit [Thermoleophilaceae bacterium]
MVATTPKPTPLMRRLLRDPAAVITRMTTFDNADNLAPAFIAQMRQRYGGTRLGRQELWGELLEDVEGALWKRAWIDDQRVDSDPPAGFTHVVVGLDPADGTADGAEQALVVAGFGLDRQFYVLHSEGMRDTPLRWLTRAVAVAREHEAKRLVVEKNFGGRALIDVLEQAFDTLGTRVAYRVVSATAGKLTRAEPVAALYEQGRVSHIGHHPELEEQLLSFTGAAGERSPDRLDAVTWAITDLMGYGLRREHVDLANTVVPYTDH